jgi:hypothetical protein
MAEWLKALELRSSREILMENQNQILQQDLFGKNMKMIPKSPTSNFILFDFSNKIKIKS